MRLILLSFLAINIDANDIRELLLHGNCTTCHFINKSISAPAMSIVQKRYKQAFADKKMFIKFMVDFIKNPDKNNSIMLDMIKKYELMPKIAFDEDTLKEIASYLYDVNLTIDLEKK